MAAAAAGRSGGNNNNGGDVSCVLRAVAEGEPATRVRELIEQYASANGVHTHGSEDSNARRAAAVNYEGGEDDDETPLWLACISERGDLVGVLLENGALATAVGPRCIALALAIHYDLADTLRALLRSGRHQVDEALLFYYKGDVRGSSNGVSCHAVHLAVVPPRRTDDSDEFEPPPPDRGDRDLDARVRRQRQRPRRERTHFSALGSLGGA